MKFWQLFVLLSAIYIAPNTTPTVRVVLSMIALSAGAVFGYMKI